MALLSGFPPSNTISPSVRIAEKDNSFFTAAQTFHRAGLVGFASKGPINLPTLVTSSRQLHTIFGYPHPQTSDPFMLYAGDQYLLTGSELFVVRVAVTDPVDDEAATTACTPIEGAGGIIKIYSATAENYTFADNQFFRWRLNGVLASKTLVALADTYTAAELAQELNDQLDAENDGIQFYVHTDSGTNYIAVKTVFAYGPDSSFEFVSVQDSMYGVGGITGLGTGMTQAETIGTEDRYPSGGYVPCDFDFTGLSDLNIQLVTDGTDNVTIDNVVQTISLAGLEGSPQTMATIVTYINSVQLPLLPGGWEAFASGCQLGFRTLHSGRDARLLIKSTSTTNDIFGFDNLTAVGLSPLGVAAFDDTTPTPGLETFGRVTGADVSPAITSITICADSPGIDGNNTQVVITNDIHEPVFTIAVYNNGVQQEVWGGLNKDVNDSFYVETFINTVSDWIRVTDNTDNGAPPANGTYLLGDPLVSGSTSGSDGIPADPDEQDAMLIGDPLAFTGMYILSEPEQIDIDMIAIPGHPSTSVILAMLDLCENYRMDCLAIIDPPFGLTVNEIVQWQNGVHPLNNTRFDSDFGALYWPWVKVRDGFNRVDVWVPPSGSVMATIARSDAIGAPWFAPAGETRGIVPGVLDVFSRPTLAERDFMYGNRNCINPIIQFVDLDGFVIWGQKTLQRRPSALDRVNVRRMLFVAEKRIRRDVRTLLFEPNDDIFRRSFISICTNILGEIKTGRGLIDFIIKADDELNTPDVIDRNEFRARIGVQPTRAVEFIFIEFSIHRTGSFAENA